MILGSFRRFVTSSPARTIRSRSSTLKRNDDGRFTTASLRPPRSLLNYLVDENRSLADLRKPKSFYANGRCERKPGRVRNRILLRSRRCKTRVFAPLLWRKRTVLLSNDPFAFPSHPWHNIHSGDHRPFGFGAEPIDLLGPKDASRRFRAEQKNSTRNGMASVAYAIPGVGSDGARNCTSGATQNALLRCGSRCG